MLVDAKQGGIQSNPNHDLKDLVRLSETVLKRIRVLLVDDELVVLETVQALLEPIFDVVPHVSPRAALELLRFETFDVVCTDYKMPEINGIEFLQLIGTLKCQPSVIVMTGRDKSFYEAQANAFCLPRHSLLLKPYDPIDLIDAIERSAALSRMRKTAEALSLPNHGKPVLG